MTRRNPFVPYLLLAVLLVSPLPFLNATGPDPVSVLELTGEVGTAAEAQALDDLTLRLEGERASRSATESTTTTTQAPAKVTTTTLRKRPKPAPKPAPKSAVPVAPSPSGDVWSRLADCETGDRRKDESIIWGTRRNSNTGNGYYGYFQFTERTWRSVGGTGLPHQHSYDVQRSMAIKLQQRSGWGQWPDCRRRLGL